MWRSVASSVIHTVAHNSMVDDLVAVVAVVDAVADLVDLVIDARSLVANEHATASAWGIILSEEIRSSSIHFETVQATRDLIDSREYSNGTAIVFKIEVEGPAACGLSYAVQVLRTPHIALWTHLPRREFSSPPNRRVQMCMRETPSVSLNNEAMAPCPQSNCWCTQIHFHSTDPDRSWLVDAFYTATLPVFLSKSWTVGLLKCRLGEKRMFILWVTTLKRRKAE